ncbi:hypothetical protein FPY71_15780 [Aureimonas fodinaquatilis]|uniref:AlgX/AlgJ SGNH hydrolase-like domain-containing protein n=1 Tax=Aureimonas fodinaquatilis TaxID=2565783 RepID=A0A5B0DTX5_9HYPH|nr:hypothetical protein [Aureimonas fodinaquatilis]KAA0969010.1 hypothetical protein FPY71_15780 [Aureimonas fodinaquatilis]
MIAKPDQRGYRGWATALCGSVLIVLVFAWATPWLKLPEPGLAENRVLAEAPAVPASLRGIVHFPQELNSYIEDQFPPRRFAISGLNFLRYHLRYSGVPRVIVGPNGWLFYDIAATFAYQQGIPNLSESETERLVSGVVAYDRQLQENGRRFYVMAAPVKSSAFPQEVPNWLEMSEVDAARVAKAFADANEQNRFIYPVQEVQSTDELSYSPNDTHWNYYGAYAAYEKLIETIAKEVPAVGAPAPMETPDTASVPAAAIPRDLALMLGIANWVSGSHPSKVTFPPHDPARTTFLSERTDWAAAQVWETDAPSGLTLLLVRDSFSTEMLPLLKSHFSKLVIAHLDDGFLRDDLIEQYDPDVVVFELQEAGTPYMRHMKLP